MSGRNAGGPEDLAAKLKEAWETNRRLHRRLQAVEGPMRRQLEEAVWERDYWRERRREVGSRMYGLMQRAYDLERAARPWWRRLLG